MNKYWKVLGNFLSFFKGTIDFGIKTDKIIDSLRELVNMLFAVVVGVGLEQIKVASISTQPMRDAEDVYYGAYFEHEKEKDKYLGLRE